MTLADVYQSHKLKGQTGKIARDLLEQTHWFTTNAEFDPKTGATLPQALSAFLAKVAEPKPDGNKQDRLYRITEHARCAMERLLRTLNESPRREHALLPVRAVRELDASCFMKLSTRPGRNIREKLAGKPYLQAVRRYQSVDLAENRLLKAYACRLTDLLELRREYLGEADALLPIMRSWLRSDAAKTIGRWENLPPNNTLLSHRDYRRVWDSWRQLQTLDSDIARDLSRLDERHETMQRWNEYALKYFEGTHLFADMPVLFDYEEFTIHPWGQAEPLIREAPRRISRSHEKKRVTEPVCVDLAELRPRFAVSSKGSQALSETYLWQQWEDENVISLFDSDAAFLHPSSTSIASADIFFSSDGTDEHRKRLDRAGHAFASKLRRTFCDDTLVWLVPEFLNDFELGTIRRNLNAQFPNAEPLPRSVAAVFDQVDYSGIRRDGYTILVVDTAGGITTATKLIARFDSELKKRVPETNGYCWEHCPPVILSHRESGEYLAKDRHYDMIMVDGNGNWHNGAPTERAPSIDAKSLKSDQRVGKFDDCITISDSPVAGGIKLHALQARADGRPLWREQIPELSIKGYVNGFWGRFYLVDKYTPVPVNRGASISIKINATFPLPAGKRDYSFPLFRGDNDSALGFEAHLKSTAAFPLKSATVCKLHLTYTYGDDEPYKLIFEPLDGSFAAVRTTWRRPEYKIITDASAPEYPEPMSWSDLRAVPKPDSDEKSDLLEWVISAVNRLDRDLFVHPRPRTVGALTTEWIVDRNGDYFAFAECAEVNERVFLHQRSFIEGVDYASFQVGDQLSFELQERGARYSGWKAAPPDYHETTRMRQHDGGSLDDLIKNIRKRLYFPIIQVWRDGRSIRDRHCPKEFTKAAENCIGYLVRLLDMEDLSQAVKSEILFLLACLHKDAPDACVKWMKDQVESGDIRDRQALAYALGDMSLDWQDCVFRRLASSPDNTAVSVFAYAIWREQHFVDHFALKELDLLLPVLCARLVHLHPHQREDGMLCITAKPLELLLGLLRTRASDDPDIRMLLQPHQKMTKHFAEQIDRIEDMIAKSGVTLFSRVQINIQKPEGVLTPDLLYALRLYLTGDDGANAIHISGISENDDD